MKSEHVLTFNSIMGKQKFTYTAGLVNTCPFCERSALTDILDEDGPILLVKNKFQVIEDAYQTVLIETDSCDASFVSLCLYTLVIIRKMRSICLGHPF